jgi:hypothetical protein
LCFGKDPTRLSLPLSCEQLLEEIDPLSNVAHGPPPGHDADHVPRWLEHDLGSGFDLMTIGDGLGDGDLQLARGARHVLTPARIVSLSAVEP